MFIVYSSIERELNAKNSLYIEFIYYDYIWCFNFRDVLIYLVVAEATLFDDINFCIILVTIV